jgi:hypothetical protein
MTRDISFSFLMDINWRKGSLGFPAFLPFSLIVLSSQMNEICVMTANCKQLRQKQKNYERQEPRAEQRDTITTP